MKFVNLAAAGLLLMPGMANAASMSGNSQRLPAAMPGIVVHAQLMARSERQELLSQINASIQLAPDHACALGQRAIEGWVSDNVAKGDLLANVRTTVFHEPTNSPPKLSGYEALLEQSRQESARSEAAARALYAGRQVPVGEQANVSAPQYAVNMSSIKATERIDNGLKCSANVGVSSSLVGTSASFWSPINYTIVLDTNEADGWNASFVTFPEQFSEEYALAHPDIIKIHFGGKDLSLAEARQASAAARARDVEYERKLAASIAYDKSPAGRAEAAARQQQVAVDNSRRARACEAHGGTWGYRQNPWGPLGCYFQTVGK